MISTMAIRWVPVFLTLCMIGCGPAGGNGEAPREEERAVAPEGSEPATPGAGDAATAEEAPVILFVGTSLTAGYGIRTERAYPALIAEKIERAGLSHEVVNAGRSGETSAGALGRIDWLLRQPFDVLVLETGANDMLRGVSPSSTRENIEAIVERVRAARPEATIVLVGMRAAPNLGATYVEAFERIYPDLAAEHDLALVPFILEGVAGERRLNLADGIHPNERGHERLAETVWEVLEGALR